MTVVTKTHCPTCGAECSVNIGTTHFYIPKEDGVLSDGQALIKIVGELEAENERLLTLATKWCDKSHHDWHEILKIAKEG